MLLVHAPGAESPELERELRLVGLDVESARGTEREASEAIEARGVTAVVFLDRAGATIWVNENESHSKGGEPVHIERSGGESSEMFALRSAELLRGKLLPGGPEADPSEKPQRDSSIDLSERSLSLTLGPALMLQSYAVVAPGITGDFAAWFGRVGVGPYFSLPLVRNSWTGTKNALTFTQYSLGFGGRFLPFQTRDNTFELDALLRVGVTRLALRRDTGPQAQRFAATGNFFSVEGGVEGSFAVKGWLRLGGQTVAGLDIPLSRPIPEGVALPPPSKGKAEGTSVESVQRHLIVSAVAIVQF